MKKIGLVLFVIVLISTVFVSGFQSRGDVEPNTVYEVYLDDEVIGKVKSKEALEDYIDERGEDYKRKFNVDKVYAPNGLEIKKVVTYNEETDSISDIYEKISEKNHLRSKDIVSVFKMVMIRFKYILIKNLLRKKHWKIQ